MIIDFSVNQESANIEVLVDIEKWIDHSDNLISFMLDIGDFDKTSFDINFALLNGCMEILEDNIKQLSLNKE